MTSPSPRNVQPRPRLADIPLFSTLTEEELAQLGLRSQLRSFESRETVFHEGGEATGLYVVADGRVKVFKVSPKGKEQILHLLGPGEPLGEVALFAGTTFPATAETLEPTRIFYVARGALLELIHEDSEVALRMMAYMSFRLRGFAALVEDLSLREVAGRVATYILMQSRSTPEGAPVNLGLTKTEMASVFGTAPETLSRAFRQLADQDAIETRGRLVRVKNPHLLEKAAWTLPADTDTRPRS
jgi:CRP/FNR family transcriptional regulator